MESQKTLGKSTDLFLSIDRQQANNMQAYLERLDNESDKVVFERKKNFKYFYT